MTSPEPRISRHDVEIAVDPVRLPGDLVVPVHPSGVVVFAHGSGSSRLSPRNVAVADRLNRSGLATLLFDLLTEFEAADRERVFDIDLLATRLRGGVRWVRRKAELTDVPVALFGASTGAAAALVAAASLHNELAAIVSRGGRPDLAGDALEQVTVPTLLIVGGEDRQVLELNREARARLAGPSALAIVPGAGHLFEEPGALDRVAELAVEWITDHLAGAPGGGVSLLDVF